MTETENNAENPAVPTSETTVAVVFPLFPKLPGVRESLASLEAQTRPPNLVVLLDDGSNPEAELLHEVVPSLHVEVVQVEPGSLSSALEAVSAYLSHFDYISLLLAGDAYEPARIETCLRVMLRVREERVPFMVVTGIMPVDSRGRVLPATDPRAEHLDRLWKPGRAGAGLADWLGTGYFAGPASNIFVRREFLTSVPLPENAQHLPQMLVLSAAMQGLLAVEHQPLLRHYPPLVDRAFSLRAASDNLQVQLALLLSLNQRLAFSMETRRNLAAYHRAAWNSLSGLREDLFQQLVMQLASQAAPDTAKNALEAILHSREANTVPAHWSALFDGADRLDLAGYADALRRTREKLSGERRENARLTRIAAAAKESGWLRFAAWVGERSARRVMELDEEDNMTAAKEEEPAAEARSPEQRAQPKQT